MASKRDLWDHVMKHVHSVSKVQHVRKNILLSRLKKNKFQGIQKCDEVGNKIHLLGEVKHGQAKLQKAREEAQEFEKILKNQTSLLKVAGCRRCHLQNIADNTEKRCLLLKMSGETIRALTDAFSSSSKCISLVKAPRISMHSSNIEHHSTIGSVEEYTNEIPHVPVIPPVSVECKKFLEKCVSMAKDLLDEKLETLSIERASSNSSAISDFSQLCIDSRFMDFDTLKVYNAMSETKKNELKSFISNSVKDFSGQHLFESLLSLISEKHKKMPIFYDDHYSTLHQKMYGEERINELECLLLEKLTHLHASVTHDFAIAAQEKVVALRMKNELKRLMSCIEKDLNVSCYIDAKINK
ncbi:hypothetical protein J437_LFUL016268 [Ladona fulva]|uniref:Uncharacterized protein n=1 Tax=Ladona fulva TaxID=123851 RepID=A0A8K0KLB6_LADFU|nr:hypothetical protein J437_LFUL016268 [Ladona fulva]